jgi:peptide/nickel transport system substrate-binding protein
VKSRLWLAAAACVAGAGLMAASALAAGSGVSAKGGTLRVDNRSDFDFVDPALSYFSHTWQMMYVTCAKLVNFPDAEGEAGTRLVPEVASAMPAVSPDGKTFTFSLKKTFKFSTGQPVTAQTFAYAWQRASDPRLNSPAVGYTKDIASTKAIGNWKLRVTLKKQVPDFLSRLTMPFFCPLPVGTPIVPEGISAPVPGSGPYYVKEWVRNRTAVLERNPNYKGGRTANPDRIVYTIGNTQDASRLRLERGETDLGPIPPAATAELLDKYGLNKSRFFIRKNLVQWYLAFNHDRPLFKNNAQLKRAVSHALDRPALARQQGLLAGARTDQLLPIGMPGYRDWNIYSLKGANVKLGQQLAKGHTRDGKAVMYTFNSSHGPTTAQVVQFNLKQIGIDVEIRMFDRVVGHEKSATRGEPFDISYDAWNADYPDPSNFLNTLLDGGRIQADHNTNTAYFNDPSINKRLAQASRLGGQSRYDAYSLLDRDIIKDKAPLAPFLTVMSRVFVGPNVGCFSYHPVYQTNLAAVCLK